MARILIVAGIHRIGGDWDKVPKVVAGSALGYAAVYRRLTDGVGQENMIVQLTMWTSLRVRALAAGAVRSRIALQTRRRSGRACQPRRDRE